MGLFDWLGKLVHEDAVHRTQIRIPADHVLTGGPAPISPVAEEHYIRIWLSEMFLRESSTWFTKRYPLTYSLVEMNYAGQSTEFANVSGKNKLDVKKIDLGRALLYNYPMTPLLPFRGGTVSIDCGLVSMSVDNVVTKFAGVVSDFAGKLGGAQVASVTNLAASIAESVQDLLGAGNAVSKLYYHNAFGGAGGATAMASGFILLSEKAEGSLDASRLWITEDGIREGKKGEALKPLSAQDYLIFQIECPTERDDYRSFTYVREPFEQALDAKGEGDETKGQVLLRQAKRAVQKSADFTALDRKRIIAALDAGYADDGWMTGGNESVESVASPMDAFLRSPFADAIAMISIEAARALPELELESDD